MVFKVPELKSIWREEPKWFPNIYLELIGFDFLMRRRFACDGSNDHIPVATDFLMTLRLPSVDGFLLRAEPGCGERRMRRHRNVFVDCSADELQLVRMKCRDRLIKSEPSDDAYWHPIHVDVQIMCEKIFGPPEEVMYVQGYKRV